MLNYHGILVGSGQVFVFLKTIDLTTNEEI